MNQPYWSDADVTLFLGDCLDVLAGMDEGSIDAVVTDPPYGLEFMGKEWDRFSGDVTDRDFKGFVLSQQRTRNVKCPDCGKWAYDHPGRLCECGGVRRAQGSAYQRWCEVWAAECLRVLKPGGHLLAFGGTRTYHRVACAIEDAGFEIRDSIDWIYGSGFPKSLNVSKAIDKAAGAEREVVGTGHRSTGNAIYDKRPSRPDGLYASDVYEVTAPATGEATRWQGWGTALKPAHEPIVVARKSLAGTVVSNVLAHGTGALNIDACRVEAAGRPLRLSLGSDTPGKATYGSDGPGGGSRAIGSTDEGRWPPNILLTHSPDCEPLGVRTVRSDGHHPAVRGAGGLSTSGHSGQAELAERKSGTETVEAWACAEGCPVAELDRQSGVLASGANPTRRGSDVFSRDIYGDFAGQKECVAHRGADSGGASRFFPVFRYEAKAGAGERPRDDDGTAHPTVKPVDLMAWLVRLVTPPGGLVLDPFAGSGTTAEACIVEGFRSVLIEKEPASAALIRKRLSKPIQPAMFG